MVMVPRRLPVTDWEIEIWKNCRNFIYFSKNLVTNSRVQLFLARIIIVHYSIKTQKRNNTSLNIYHCPDPKIQLNIRIEQNTNDPLFSIFIRKVNIFILSVSHHR